VIEAALGCLAFLAVLAGPADVASPEAPAPAAIENLEVRAAEDGLKVSFDLRGAFDEDVVDRIQSGLAVTFRHRVELLARRLVPVIPSRVLGRTVIETSARYDSLTRQYYLTRRTTRDPAGHGMEPAVEDESAVAASMQDTEAWMSSFREIPLPAPPPENERKLRVRVRCVLGRHYRLLIFPTDDAVDAEQVLAR
jgi:hypothetical protein